MEPLGEDALRSGVQTDLWFIDDDKRAWRLGLTGNGHENQLFETGPEILQVSIYAR